MAKQFKEQGGAATMDPNPILRFIQSKVMTRVAAWSRTEKKRTKAETARLKAGLPHVIDYFHEVDDGYSHLAAQVLPRLIERYDVQVNCHLVTGPVGNNAPEPDLLLRLSRYDSAHVAAYYGLEFPADAAAPAETLVRLAGRILAAQNDEHFVANAAQIGRALWANDEATLQALAGKLGSADDATLTSALETGNARRDQLAHYSGAMFYYAGEWYWGVDRLYHLEQRLAELGADQQAGQPLLVPRPGLDAGELRDNGSLTLEVYPSLRSPYTAISFDRAVQLAERTGVTLVVRPVLPMVMRGVPATMQKGMYIFWDTAREARAAEVAYGPFYDPIGEPVRRAYSLYPWACEQGKGVAFLSSFLRKAFAEGVNTNNNKGLKAVVEAAGLDWSVAKPLIGQPGWEEQLEANRLVMYEAGLWGVPSFRLLDENGTTVLALWGQDRLWLFAKKIQEQLAARN